MLKITAEFNPVTRETEFIGYITNIRHEDNSAIFVTAFTIEQIIYKLCNEVSSKNLKVRTGPDIFNFDYKSLLVEDLNDLNRLVENAHIFSMQK